MTEQERLETLRRRCATCRETKPWSQFSPKTRWPDGSVRTVTCYCHSCMVKRSLDYQARNKEKVLAYRRDYERGWRQTPSRREYMREWESTNAEHRLQTRRAWTARNLEAQRKYKREWVRRKRVKVRKQQAQTTGNAGGFLPVKPLGEFLTEKLRFYNQLEIAAMVGVDERRIRDWMNGVVAHVGFVQADRTVTRLDGVFEVVYPMDLYTKVGRYYVPVRFARGGRVDRLV